MLASKMERQAKLLELIEKNIITTQEDLLNMLIASGVRATQATVSRDIRALRITKTPLPDGGYRYICPTIRDSSVKTKLRDLFATSIHSVAHAGNIISINCDAGMANPICIVIDSEKWDGVLGSIAGDDTIFILVKTPELAAELSAMLSSYI